MTKKNLYIDFDGVIASTIETICNLYNNDFCFYPDYQYIDWVDVNTWEFTELNCATPEYIDHYFNQPRFFEKIKLMPNCEYAIEKLKDVYDIKIISMGNTANLWLKKLWLKRIFPDCEFIGCEFSNHSDKSHINMAGAVLIDDLAANLETSNADMKICFGDIYSWNESWNGKRCYNWYEVLRYLGLT